MTDRSYLEAPAVLGARMRGIRAQELVALVWITCLLACSEPTGAAPDAADLGVDVADAIDADVAPEDVAPDLNEDVDEVGESDLEVGVDTQPGELRIEFDGLADGEVLWGRRAVGIRVVSGRPTRARFYLDEELIRDDDAPPFAALFDADELTSVAHELSVIAEDESGATVELRASFVVDRERPTITVIEPGTRYDGPIGGSLTVEVEVADNHEVAFVELEVDGERLGRLQNGERGGIFDVGEISGGAHALRATAYDWTGLSRFVEVSIFVCSDAEDFPCAGRCRHPDELESALGDCGGCGIQCGVGELCEGGTCLCPSPRELCEGECTDPVRDVENCGACGVVCGEGQGCLDGSCVDGVPEGFVLIGPGTFVMGSEPDDWGAEPQESPAHQVTLTRPFLLGETEVTHAQWRRFFDANPSAAWDCGDACPVEALTWFEAVEYANALSRAEGLRPCYLLGACDDAPIGLGRSCFDAFVDAPLQDPVACEGYRLPTEAEWEFAARGGSVGNSYPGEIDSLECDANPDLRASAWFDCNSGSRPMPTGELRPNPFGLYDMLGNVFEWTTDQWAEYPSTAQVDPLGRSEDIVMHAIRGGAFNERSSRIRTTTRLSQVPQAGLPLAGFRVARTYQP